MVPLTSLRCEGLLLTQRGSVAFGRLSFFTKQLGLDETRESLGECKAIGLTWSFDSAEVQGMSVDFAMAQSGDTAFVVLLQSTVNGRDTLYEAVFLPAIEALAPLA